MSQYEHDSAMVQAFERECDGAPPEDGTKMWELFQRLRAEGACIETATEMARMLRKCVPCNTLYINGQRRVICLSHMNTMREIQHGKPMCTPVDA